MRNRIRQIRTVTRDTPTAMPTMAPVEIELEDEEDEGGAEAEESLGLLGVIEGTVVVAEPIPAPWLVVVIPEAPVALLSGVAIPQSYENSSQNTAPHTC